MQEHFISSWFRISSVNPLFCAAYCCYSVNTTLVCAWLPLWWTLLWCVPDYRYGGLYSGVCLTAGIVNTTLVCAWLLLWWTLLWCVPDCCYGELYSGVCLTAAMVNSTLVCAWLLIWWTLLWCMPDCYYNEPNCVYYCPPLPHSPNPLSFHALLTSSQLPLCGLHRGLLWCIVTVRSTLILHFEYNFLLLSFKICKLKVVSCSFLCIYLLPLSPP